MKFKKEVTFTPAHRSKDSVSCVYIHFVLIGKHGAVYLELSTGWYLPTVESKLDPWTSFIGFHSKKKLYDGHEVQAEKCIYTGNKKCYGGGSGLYAEKMFDVLTTGGSKAIWAELEKYYMEIFCEENESEK